LRIKGYFKGNAPYILLSIKSERPKIRRQINFLIDTGSDITGISTKDCFALGLSFNKLGRPVGSISGLAEKARRWGINKAEVRAISADNKLAKFGPMKIYVMETTPDCPSLLGRDILEKYGLKLVCDIKNKVTYLED
jgi:hypothetical protein